MHRKNIRALSLIVCTLTYLMIGAAIFDVLESETDMKKRQILETMRSRMFEKYNFTQDDFRVLETVVYKSIAQKTGQQWKFVGAFYFSTVVITTVGYGHSTPSTKMGKIFCMLYALCGIPLNLVMFQSIGERLNALIAYILMKIKKLLRLNNTDVSHSNVLMVSGTLGTMVIVFGTYAFHKYENWTLFEAFWYCYSTLSTIGFGDYVAMQKKDSLKQPAYVIFSLLFILFGLAIFSAAVNLFVLKFMATNTGHTTENEDQSFLTRKIFLKNFRGETTTNDRQGADGETKKNNVQESIHHHSYQSNSTTTGNKTSVSSSTGINSEEAHFDPRNHCSKCFKWARVRFINFCDRTKKSYRVRRSPVRIDHLVESGPVSLGNGHLLATDSDSIDSSFLLNSLLNRRMTMSTV
uniref:Potassium channel domain-containing protein n=1 Tax=Romanomermis culicivorax TaxID=13658 RepID=A0A915HMJ9_ROMCU